MWEESEKKNKKKYQLIEILENVAIQRKKPIQGKSKSGLV
jgi:hypothetical protein